MDIIFLVIPGLLVKSGD